MIIASFIGLAAASPALAQTPPAAAPAQDPVPAARTDVIKILDERFAGIDSNHDGSLTAAELQAVETQVIAAQKAQLNQAVERGFANLDTNKDGRLSLDEYRAAAPVIEDKAAENAAQLVKLLDTDKDGKISSAEFKRRTLTAFDKLDSNKDGKVTPAERAKAGVDTAGR